MRFESNDLNRALVEVLADLLTGDSQRSAKQLQGSIGAFFFLAAGGCGNAGPENKPEGYCHPYRSDLTSLKKMCGAISEVRDDATCSRRQRQLIRKIYELSEMLMATFRQQRDAGTYGGNTAYICDLSPTNDWGRQMIALDEVFGPRKR